MKRGLFIILTFLFVCQFSFGQNTDTTINEKQFNYIEYYPSTMIRGPKTTNKHQVLCVGNYSDSLKNGYWVYFDIDGSVFAKGDYKNGRKIGKWYYHSKKHGHQILS